MASEREYDHLFKFIFVGDNGVDKHKILSRFADDDRFSSPRSTIGEFIQVILELSQGNIIHC